MTLETKEKDRGPLFMDLRGVSAGYDEELVLEGVDLAIHGRDFIGIIGPNGGGKTTLLKVMLGLLAPVSGQVRYFLGDNGNPRSRIGYLPQLNLFDQRFPITVSDVVMGGLVAGRGLLRRYSGDDYRRANRVMEQMGVVEIKKRPIGELSGGQLQRTFLARALVGGPRVLLLDEPDTFIDNTFADSFYELLAQINREVAIVLVSHDLGMISSQVKSIACVNRTLHYHDSAELTQELLEDYRCPIDLITHGRVPHRVLKNHDESSPKRPTGRS